MKTYLGARNSGEAVIHGGRWHYPRKDVTVVVVGHDHKGRMLPLCTEHVNHSPTGFEWGYGGSGPAQLAFAILFDHFHGDEKKTRAWYQTFKWTIIADLHHDEWELTSDQIDLALQEIREELDRAATYADSH